MEPVQYYVYGQSTLNPKTIYRFKNNRLSFWAINTSGKWKDTANIFYGLLPISRDEARTLHPTAFK